MTEGLPLGTRIKRVDYSAMYLNWYAELEPDNVYGVLDLTTVAIPDGYKRVEKDWFREPRTDEFCVSSIDGSAVMMTYRSTCGCTNRIILEPIKRTRRVLVSEYKVVDNPYPIAVDEISEQAARHAANTYGHMRIEERPI